MTSYSEQRNLSYTPEQLFALVAEVERYPDFLPWCIGSDITRREDDGRVLYNDLVIGYKMVRESFGSKVTLEEPHHIHVEYISGPMKYLSNRWKFTREEDGSCTIDFFVDFEFKNKFLQHLMGVFFDDIVRQMVKAFESRAKGLYGESGLDQEVKSFITG